MTKHCVCVCLFVCVCVGGGGGGCGCGAEINYPMHLIFNLSVKACSCLVNVELIFRLPVGVLLH